MLDKFLNNKTGVRGQAPRPDRPAKDRWENEGGSSPDGPSLSSTVQPDRAADDAPTEAAASALDARQEELMTAASTDGRPPSRRLRKIQWRWLAFGAIVVIVGFGVYAALAGTSLKSIALGVAFAVLLLAGASPVLAAGYMRGKEERAARRIARSEQREGQEGVVQ